MSRIAHVALAAVLLAASSFAQAREVKVAFTIAERDLVPEGIAYDPVERAFFVSSTYRRKVVRIDATGKASDFTKEMQDGLLGAVGMRVDGERRVLWVANSHVGEGMPIMAMEALPANASALAKYDLRTGKLLAMLKPPRPDQPHFLNDLALAADGTAYVSDTMAGDIYLVRPGAETMELFVHLDDGRPNGLDLARDGSALIVAAYGPGVVKIDLATKRQTVLQAPPDENIAADGLYVVGNSVIAIQPGSKTRMVARFDLSSDGTRLERPAVLVPSDHPALDQPTTGVVVGDDLFLVANSQLQRFRKLYAETKGNVPTDALKGPIILAVPLDR
jgi:sugar lactone lactonase YvrE